MKIVITTPIYPPQVGGPSQYASNLTYALFEGGHDSTMLAYGFEKHLPTGIRHFLFFVRAVFSFIRADLVIILDTFSVGLPSICAAKLLGKKTIIRIGGDFLWESYVERTGDLVRLRNFYETHLTNLSLKEKLIFKITHWVLENSSHLVFSTDWQRQIWTKPYGINVGKTAIIENYYGDKEHSHPPQIKNFVSPSRSLKLKNKRLLFEAFQSQKVQACGAVLDESISTHDALQNRLKNCYAVIVPSVSEVSPNLILEALRYNKPFILTEETGLYEKLKNVALFVDPLSPADISDKIEFLAKESTYEEYKRRVSAFAFTHSWEEIAKDFLSIIK